MRCDQVFKVSNEWAVNWNSLNGNVPTHLFACNFLSVDALDHVFSAYDIDRQSSPMYFFIFMKMVEKN